MFSLDKERMKCPHCGEAIEAEFRFCPFCGKALTISPKFQNVPVDTKKGHLLGLLTLKQMSRLATTSKGQAEWLQPILQYLSFPLKKRIAILKDDGSPMRKLLTEDVILPMLLKANDYMLWISLLEDLSDTPMNKNLKKEIRKMLEDRIKDRNYRKGIKSTIIKDYIKHLLKTNQKKRIDSFLLEITSPHVKSQFIQQYLALVKKDLSPTTLSRYVQMIPDTYLRQTTRRTVL